jgi:hypothetical protein
MKIINLTPHEIDVLNVKTNSIITYPTDLAGRVARCELNSEVTDTITNNQYINPTAEHNIYTNIYGDVYVMDRNGKVTDFPKLGNGILYIVSAMVANALKRPDCIIVANRLRNPDGTLGAASGFSFVN